MSPDRALSALDRFEAATSKLAAAMEGLAAALREAAGAPSEAEMQALAARSAQAVEMERYGRAA